VEALDDQAIAVAAFASTFNRVNGIDVGFPSVE